MEAKKDIQGFAPKDGANRPDLSTMLDWGETGMAALLSLCGALWLWFMMIHAGPLWRDEVSSLNLAQAASLRDFWDHLADDSCPILWPATLRGWISLGLSGDLQIRVLGFLIGLFILTVLPARLLAGVPVHGQQRSGLRVGDPFSRVHSRPHVARCGT
jgi:hypothetical protein